MRDNLRFNNIEFQAVDQNGVPWLRGPQIGASLGYHDGGKKITELYQRHSDEFSPSMTDLVMVETAGGKQKVRIFSPRGCWLIGMFARTTQAKAFRRWVLDVLDQARTASPQPQPQPQAAPRPTTKPHAGQNINFLNLPPDTPHPLELQKRLDDTEAALGRSRKQAGAHLRGLVGSMQAMNASLRDIAARVDDIGAHIQAPHNSFPKMARAAEHDGSTPLPCRVPHPPTIRTQAQHELLAYFKKHGTHVSTYRTISAETGLPWPTVRNVVAKFVGEGILAKTSWSSGSNRALCFIVAN